MRLSLNDETLDRLRFIPSHTWYADDRQREKYERACRPVGKTWHRSVTLFLEKEGIPVPESRSWFEPEALFGDQFFNYWRKIEIKWDERAFSFAFRRTMEAFEPLGKVDPYELEQVATEILYSDKALKGAGAPTFAKKRDALYSDLKRAKAIATGRVAPPPCVAYHRSHPGKVRMVWGYPLSMTLLEGMFAIPLMDAVMRTRTPYVLGYSSNGMSGRLAALSYGTVQFCLDWSKYDSTVPRRVINVAFRVLRSHLNLVDETVWKVVAKYFATCPVLMPDFRIYYGRVRGVPSGSYFTQIIDSVCNTFLAYYVSYKLHEGISDLVVLGDDSVLAMNRMPDVQAWSTVAEELGMGINPAKQVITHGVPHFLGHWWGNVPFRPMEETIERLASSEKYVNLKGTDLERYLIEKAKALAIDNPSSYWFMVRYVAFLKRCSPWYVHLLWSGPLDTGTLYRTGFSRYSTMGDITHVPYGFIRSRMPEQMLRH